MMDLEGLSTDLGKAAAQTTVGGVQVASYRRVPPSPELPCIYVGLPTNMMDFSSYGSCSLDIAVTACVGRPNEDDGYDQLSAILSTDLIQRLMTFKSDYWIDIAFKNINNIRATEFGTTNVYAADINLQLRTT